MLWFIVWTLLVLGTVAGAFFLGRDLWRKGKALVAELGRAGEMAGALADRADALAAATPEHVPSHDLFTERTVPRDRLAQLSDERAQRRELRRLRNARTVAGWRAYWR